MLTEDISLRLPRSSKRSLVHIEDIFKNLVTETTTPLTAMDHISDPEIKTQLDTMSNFQSARDRSIRMNHPQINGGGGFNGSTTGNWRRSAGSADLNMSGQEDASRQRSLSEMVIEGMVPISSVVPGSVWPRKDQMVVAYGYAIRREDGTFTRLIRADELDTIDLGEIPISQGPEGLITLPTLGLAYPERRDGPEQYVSQSMVFQLPPNRPDHPKFPAGLQRIDDVQKEIDEITTRELVKGSAPILVKTPRRTKIYCDKWIHEGVCAFTQLGCKYKHEMPLDKATQLSLGLNHGLPAWYKRAHAVQLRPEGQGSPPSLIQPRITGPWRRADGSSSHSTGLSLCSKISSSPSAQSFDRPNFGPIAPPPPQYLQQTTPSHNPYSMLQQDDSKMVEGDKDEITWSGRRR